MTVFPVCPGFIPRIASEKIHYKSSRYPSFLLHNMTTFSKSGFRSINYNSFRPHYPPSFYKILTDYVSNKTISKTIDLGCGSGVATFPLLNISQYAVGLDLSPRMVEAANQLKTNRLNQMGIFDESRIEFVQGAVEDFQAPAASFDLITAAQCIHWFEDYDSFFISAAKHLKSGGTLAYWYYVDPVFVDFSGPHDSSKSKEEILNSAFQLYHDFVYKNPKWLGKYWEQPGRGILQNELVEVDSHIPDLYTDVKINKYNAGVPYQDDDLKLYKKGINLQDFANYLSTYSSYHNFVEANEKADFLGTFLAACEKELGWTSETSIDIVWNTGYTFMKKK